MRDFMDLLDLPGDATAGNKPTPKKKSAPKREPEPSREREPEPRPKPEPKAKEGPGPRWPRELSKKHIMIESGGNPNAESPVGAQGYAQIMPHTQKDPGYGVDPVEDPSDFEESVRFNNQYMTAMMDKFGNATHAIMAWNWGPRHVDEWLESGGDWSEVPDETKGHLEKLADHARAHDLGVPFDPPDKESSPLLDLPADMSVQADATMVDSEMAESGQAADEALEAIMSIGRPGRPESGADSELAQGQDNVMIPRAKSRTAREPGASGEGREMSAESVASEAIRALVP